VGAANGRNPISIVAPCHRVIGSTGKLTGFAGGLETKAFLLAHEGPQRELAAASSRRRAAMPLATAS
jgi:methylated-DNA-[protein]-cysteine S-methyltransferase